MLAELFKGKRASGNELGPEGGKATAEALKTNQTLTVHHCSQRQGQEHHYSRRYQLRQNTVDTLDYSGQGLHVDSPGSGRWKGHRRIYS